jgi:glycosyltransferase involved in cell wall biosynthesis
VTHGSADVSVVIPTRDRRPLLMTTLASVLWQRDVDLEVIVVDDGSRDDTAEHLAAIADGRVVVLRDTRSSGVAAARNRGIDRATGAWVAFLDDDDVWAPDKLVSQLGVANATGARWAYAGAVKIDESNRLIGGTPAPSPDAVMRRLRRWSLIPGGCSGVVARRSLLDAVGVFDPDLVNLADWDLWIRLATAGPPACAATPLVGYRLHARQSSTDVDLILREATVMRGKGLAHPDLGALHHYLAHKSLIGGRRRTALKHFALASLHGEIAPVASALWSMGRARVAPHSASRSHRDAGATAQWREQARTWLSRLPNPTSGPDTVASPPGASAREVVVSDGDAS